MGGRNISVTELVTAPVIKVTDIILIRNVIVKLYHCIFGLCNRHLREMSTHCIIFLIRHIGTEPVYTSKTTSSDITAILIDTTHFHEAAKERTITFHINASNTEIADIRAVPQQSLPVNQGATVNYQANDIVSTFQSQVFVGQFIQIAQVKRLKSGRKNSGHQRGTLRKSDSGQRRIAGMEHFKFRIVGKVDASESTGLQSGHIQSTEMAAVTYKKGV